MGFATTSQEPSIRVSSVEVTLMGPSLQLHSDDGAVALHLDVSQARNMLAIMERLPGYIVDSQLTPVLLGGSTPTRGTARPIVAELAESDCQVNGVQVWLDGNCLRFSAGGASDFLRLNDVQRAQVANELSDLLPR